MSLNFSNKSQANLLPLELHNLRKNPYPKVLRPQFKKDFMSLTTLIYQIFWIFQKIPTNLKFLTIKSLSSNRIYTPFQFFSSTKQAINSDKARNFHFPIYIQFQRAHQWLHNKTKKIKNYYQNNKWKNTQTISRHSWQIWKK